MQETLTERVTYHEHPTRQLLEDVRKEGYFPANGNGVAVEGCFDPEMWSVGILTPYVREEKERKGFFRNLLYVLVDIGTAQGEESWRRPWIGNISLRNDYDYTRDSSDRHWTFEVFGTQNVDKMKTLAVKLAEKYHVQIDVKLERSWELKECESDDFSD